MGIGAAITGLASWLGGAGTAAAAGTAATVGTAATTGITAAQALGTVATIGAGAMSAKAISDQKAPQTIQKMPDKQAKPSESIEKEVELGAERTKRTGRSTGRRQLMADRTSAPSAGSSGLNV